MEKIRKILHDVTGDKFTATENRLKDPNVNYQDIKSDYYKSSDLGTKFEVVYYEDDNRKIIVLSHKYYYYYPGKLKPVVRKVEESVNYNKSLKRITTPKIKLQKLATNNISLWKDILSNQYNITLPRHYIPYIGLLLSSKTVWKKLMEGKISNADEMLNVYLKANKIKLDIKDVIKLSFLMSRHNTLDIIRLINKTEDIKITFSLLLIQSADDIDVSIKYLVKAYPEYDHIKINYSNFIQDYRKELSTKYNIFIAETESNVELPF